ncbi:MAG: response regulator [Nitrospiraceae bacterium]|uniref:response regulator n=1 Tax=Nitrospira cf. moscoviensis SBR1015 TaxID=96242 RepID=UPI000B3BC6EA|nr:response regulator [Nitrospira cf. moscoviensis SBR1015]MBY0249675.1 response regulator [Nitrospiraceae bacterium]
MFTDWQWDVFEASSRREALDIPDRHAIDLVLLDVGSQGVKCPALLAAIRPQARELTIIGIGAVMTENLRCDWRSRGVMECLTKPVTPQILSALLGVLAPPSGFADS